MVMQKKNELDNHKENNASLNMRQWLNNVVKNEKSLNEKQVGEDNPTTEGDKEILS